MKSYRKLALEFWKKELSSIEKSYNQFKLIYDYFQSNGVNTGNIDAKSLLELKEENSRYIFIRLYDPVYKSNLPAQLLKKGQYITNVTQIPAAHAAIGFDLKDKFYGLTIGGD